jgi:hypothetical protein
MAKEQGAAMRKVMLAGFLAFAYVLPESAGAAESVAPSRRVPVLLAGGVNVLLKSIPREYLSRLLVSACVALTNKRAAALFGASPSIKQLSTQFFLVAPSSAAVQNEGHSKVILPIQERTICAPKKS